MLDEIEALRKAVSQKRKNEVIVCFYEKLKPVQQALEELSAQPVVALPPAPQNYDRQASKEASSRDASSLTHSLGALCSGGASCL